jgi:hypothetical protein
MLHSALYGCETWSLTLGEKHRLRVFENMMLRKIFGPMGEEVAGGWRKLHSEELHNLYTSPNIITVIESRRMTWVGHAAYMQDMRNALVKKHAGKRPLQRPTWRCGSIKMNLKERGCDRVAQYRDKWQVNTVMHLLFHKVGGVS